VQHPFVINDVISYVKYKESNIENQKNNGMKKKLILLIAMAGMASYSFGQFFSLGPRVGASMSTIQIDERLTINNDEVDYNSDGARFGFHIGAYTRVMIANVYLQPELLFTSAGGTVAFNSDTRGRDIQNLKYNRMDLPVLAGIRFGESFRIQAGPVFSLILTDDAREIHAFDQAQQNFRRSTVGYQAGIGFDLSKLNIDFKYEGSLSKLGDSIRIGNETFKTDLRSSIFMVVLGYNIF